MRQRQPPLMGFRGTSWTPTIECMAIWVPPSPFGVHRPSGLPSDGHPTSRSQLEAHLVLSHPFRGHPHGSARPSAGPATCVAVPTAGSCFLSWTSITLRHIPASWIRFIGGESPRHRVPRSGFGYPLRELHHQVFRPPTPFSVTCLPARLARWSALGLLPTRGSPRPRSKLLSESYALLPLPRASALCPEASGSDARPSSGLLSRGESVPTPLCLEASLQAPRSPIPSWGFASLELEPA